MKYEERKLIHVHIGEIKLGDGDSLIKVILGSCVGIGLIWKKKGRVAVSHCLLPEGHSEDFPGRFVNEAVDNLCKIIGASEKDIPELEAVLAGGSSMHGQSHNTPAMMRVGDMNVAAAIKYLGVKKIKIVFQDVGTKNGRQFNIDSKTGECYVRVLSEA